MTINFIEEIQPSRKIYYTEINGEFVRGSLSLDHLDADYIYRRIVNNPNINKIKTILKTTTIENNDDTI